MSFKTGKFNLRSAGPILQEALERRLLKKITMTFVQITVSVLLFLIAIGLGLGII